MCRLGSAADRLAGEAVVVAVHPRTIAGLPAAQGRAAEAADLVAARIGDALLALGERTGLLGAGRLVPRPAVLRGMGDAGERRQEDERGNDEVAHGGEPRPALVTNVFPCALP
ncbi:hypothetical protein GCM10007925_02410 [Sphingomonas astaxanthinifaciens DSM 22298]|uniref:Uncharacterized protein n=1 Tax=Sphingomonas astaxanthinifaciens DSM 22298 TaxID=1123267 RepID=A0ABQ5Z3F4_9SPHN|nr:hypothetical protein GCM10007925_02410 [Sphingomonas astaxanthinifaciens DSM 22298]